jgi:hypothetical protein
MMLPDILGIARKHQLVLNDRTVHNVEVQCKCPFCGEDGKPGKRRKFYLSLNTKDQVFKCWYCGESGGVFRFIALLEGVSEEEIRARYRRRKRAHPAERLTRRQRKLIGEVVEPDWDEMKRRDHAYYLRTLDRLWSAWIDFLAFEIQEAWFWLLYGIETGRYEKCIQNIVEREKQIGVPICKTVLDIYSSSSRPQWTEDITKRISTWRMM